MKKGKVNPRQKHSGTKYKSEFAERVKFLICEAGLLNQRGQIAWERIGKVLGISPRMMKRWRNPLDAYYHKEFAEAVSQAQEAIDADQIKHSMIERAKGYTRTKTVTTSGDVCTKRKEVEKIAGDPQAAKLVLPNIGPEDKRWMEKTGIEHSGEVVVNISVKKNYVTSDKSAKSGLGISPAAKPGT